MLFNRKILVALEGTDSDDKAFKRAVLIADRMKCAMDVLWLNAPMADQPIMQLITRLQVDGLAINVLYIENKSLVKEVQRRWKDDHFSLLIKSCDTDHSGFLASLDWQLLRQTPCPVLLVKRDSLWEHGAILAAVDPRGKEEKRNRLNQVVLMMAGFIAREAQAPLQVTAAYPPPMLGAELENQSAELLKNDVEAVVHTLLASSKMKPADVWIGEGPPEHWVSQTAKENNAAVVVIGTQARSGLTGALLGNTAEKILDRLSCDVLVLREGVSEGLRNLLS